MVVLLVVVWYFVIQIVEMKMKVAELTRKKPVLKRVKLSAEQLLQVLLGSSKSTSVDFKANLKTVKKEEEKVLLMSSYLEQ